MCAVGMWDSGHVPAIECVGHEDIAGCPYMGLSAQTLHPAFNSTAHVNTCVEANEVTRVEANEVTRVDTHVTADVSTLP